MSGASTPFGPGAAAVESSVPLAAAARRAPAAAPTVHTMPAAPFKAAQRRHFLVAVAAPTLAAVLLPLVLPSAWSPWHSPGLALVLWGLMWFLVGGVGVSVGLHRCFSHRSFEPNNALRWGLGILGAMAAQGPAVYWVSLHRLHHAASDLPGDPHSPRTSARPGQSRWRAAFTGHIGWVWSHDLPKPTRYARELLADPVVCRLTRAYGACVALGLLLPALAGAWLLQASHGLWAGALFGAYWGGVVRIALGHHIIWAINSWCHLGGRRPHDTPDGSGNVAALALLSWGESWHNNHHAKPTAARFGQGPWQPDIGWWVVRAFVFMGWAKLRAGGGITQR